MKNYLSLLVFGFFLLVGCNTPKRALFSAAQSNVGQAEPDYVVEPSKDYVNEGVFILRHHRDGRKEIICIPIHQEECYLKAAIKQTEQCDSKYKFHLKETKLTRTL